MGSGKIIALCLIALLPPICLGQDYPNTETFPSATDGANGGILPTTDPLGESPIVAEVFDPTATDPQGESPVVPEMSDPAATDPQGELPVVPEGFDPTATDPQGELPVVPEVFDPTATDSVDATDSVEPAPGAREGETSAVGTPVPKSGSSSGSSALGQSVNKLAAGILPRLRDTNGAGNLVFSPLSIAACFSLLYPGADGATKQELDTVFGFQGGAVANGLLQKANSVGAAALANRVYLAPDIQALPDYVNAIGNQNFEQLDFASPQATQEINNWVSQATKGLIGDLVPQGLLSAATRMILINAIYFKGSWAEPFPKDLTQQGEFRGESGSKSVEFMMYDSFRKYRSKALPSMNAQMLEFPYDDGEHAMFVVLPDADGGWGSVEKALASNLSPSFFLDDFLNNLEFNVKMPKWEFEMSIDDLSTILTTLGLNSVFSNADLSRITDTGEPLFVSDVLHKAKIRVDEEGTEAAAGTLTAVATSLPPPAEDFHMDHPFLYFIVNLKDGTIVFQGTVTDV